MNAKEWLRHIKTNSVELETISDELNYFEKHRSTCSRSRIAELQERRDQLIEQKVMLANIVDNIADPVARSIYRSRYVTGDSWKVVATKCGGMSERNAHYIHDNTFPEFERIYLCKWFGGSEE